MPSPLHNATRALAAITLHHPNTGLVTLRLHQLHTLSSPPFMIAPHDGDLPLKVTVNGFACIRCKIGHRTAGQHRKTAKNHYLPHCIRQRCADMRSRLVIGPRTTHSCGSLLLVQQHPLQLRMAAAMQAPDAPTRQTQPKEGGEASSHDFTQPRDNNPKPLKSHDAFAPCYVQNQGESPAAVAGGPTPEALIYTRRPARAPRRAAGGEPPGPTSTLHRTTLPMH